MIEYSISIYDISEPSGFKKRSGIASLEALRKLVPKEVYFLAQLLIEATDCAYMTATLGSDIYTIKKP